MMKVKETEELLYDYFIQNSSLSLPGIGTFDMFRISAQTDFANKKILPPYYTISYDSINDAPNKELFDYVARKRNVPEWEAIKIINDFAIEIKNAIRNGEDVEWEGIGRLKAGVGGHIVFQPYRMDYEFIPHVGAHRVIRHSANHSMLVGDRERSRHEMQDYLSEEVPVVQAKAGWWSIAAMLAAIAVLLIAIRIFQGELPENLGRQKPVVPAESPELNREEPVLNFAP